MIKMIIYQLIIAGLIVNLLFYFSLSQISKIVNLYDIPNKRKIHKNSIPLLGGFLIFLNILIYLLFLENYDENFLNILIVSIFFFLLGIVDDKIDINANFKFVISLGIYLIFLLLNDTFLISKINFFFIDYEFNYFESYFFTILSLLLFLNALNMFDGINLQSLTYIFFICLVFLSKNYEINFFVNLILAIIFLLILNAKSKIFMGDNGIYIIAPILSLSIILLGEKYNSLTHPEIFMLMFMPGIDMFRVFIERVLKAKSPFGADKIHFHHLILQNFGYNYAIIFSVLFSVTPYCFYALFPNIYIFCFFLLLYLIFYIYLKKK